MTFEKIEREIDELAEYMVYNDVVESMRLMLDVVRAVEADDWAAANKARAALREHCDDSVIEISEQNPHDLHALNCPVSIGGRCTCGGIKVQSDD